MNLLTFDIINKNAPKTKFSDAQIYLQEFAGKKLARKEADDVWSRVIEHKWNISENLGRDVGLRVAAVDFIEHFYQPKTASQNISALSESAKKILRGLWAGFLEYSEIRGKYSPFL